MRVHAFLMGCRLIGRGVEFCVWQRVPDDARSRGKAVLRAAYPRTAKGTQGADFFDRLGLPLTACGDDGCRQHTAGVANLHLADSNWAELIDG